MANSAEWFPAPKNLDLAPAELHLWRVCSDRQPLQQYQELLSLDEKERAQRFVIEEARRDFVITRGTLRELLGAYLSTRPGDIVLRNGVHGKPYVARDETESRVCFNISHSKGLAVFAFSLQAEVGVDVERMREEFRGQEIAERFFSEREVAALGKVPPELSSRAFFRCWTRKEAYVKARGGGLQIPLRSFSVEIGETEEQQLVDEQGKEWSIYPFETKEGFAAAVAVEGRDWRLKLWEWRDDELKVGDQAGQKPLFTER